MKQTSGKIGEKFFTRTYTTDGGYTDDYDNDERKSYDAKGNAIAGKDAEGSYRIVNEDGRTYKVYSDVDYTFKNNGNHYKLRADEVIISCSDTECTIIDWLFNTEFTYDTNGNLTKETKKDANGDISSVDIISNKGYKIDLTSDGDIQRYEKNGESFEATMKRLKN